MNRLAFVDHRQDPASWARALGISREAVELYLGSDVIDLHIDTFIWNRVFGYDLTKRHGRGPFGARFFGQADLPRLREARVTGGIWAITTNPLRRSAGAPGAFRSNIARLSGIFERPADVRCGAYGRRVPGRGRCRPARGLPGDSRWQRARSGRALSVLDEHVGPGGLSNVLRVTLVHLSTSSLGATSAPMRGKEDRLTEAGRRYVAELDRRRIFVDQRTSPEAASSTWWRRTIAPASSSPTPAWPGFIATGETSTTRSCVPSPPTGAPWASCISRASSATRSWAAAPRRWRSTSATS